MRNIKLTENDCTFVHYVLRMYATQTPGLDREDKDQEGITEWFNFKGLTFVEYNPSIWSYL